MRIGCPKEIKNHEYRVGLTPESARELVNHGHEVWIETGAGAGIDASDAQYEASKPEPVPVSTLLMHNMKRWARRLSTGPIRSLPNAKWW